MKGKYRLTRKTLLHEGRILRRVKYEDGTLGGWIESEGNLSHEGACRVLGEAKVYGEAKVFENAQVMDSADVGGKARVYGRAGIYENAKISGDSEVHIYGSSRIYGRCEISGHYRLVTGCTRFNLPRSPRIFGNAKVFGHAKVKGEVKIYDNASIYGDASLFGNSGVISYVILGGIEVHDSAAVFGSAVLTEHAEVSGREQVSSGKRFEDDAHRAARRAREAREREEAAAREQARQRAEELERAEKERARAERAARELAERKAREQAEHAKEVKVQKECQEVMDVIVEMINGCQGAEKYTILGRVVELLAAFDSDKQKKILDLYAEWHEREGGAFAPDRSRIEDKIGRPQRAGPPKKADEFGGIAPRVPGGFGKSRTLIDDFMEDMERARVARDIARWANPPSEGEY